MLFSGYSLSLILPFVLKEVLATINSIMQRKGMFDPQWYSLSTDRTPPPATPAHHYLHAFGLEMLYYIQRRLCYTAELDLSNDVGAHVGTVNVNSGKTEFLWVKNFAAKDFYFETKVHVSEIYILTRMIVGKFPQNW